MRTLFSRSIPKPMPKPLFQLTAVRVDWKPQSVVPTTVWGSWFYAGRQHIHPPNEKLSSRKTNFNIGKATKHSKTLRQGPMTECKAQHLPQTKTNQLSWESKQRQIIATAEEICALHFEDPNIRVASHMTPFQIYRSLLHQVSAINTSAQLCTSSMHASVQTFWK